MNAPAYPTYETELRKILEKDDRVVVMTAENRAAIRNLPPLIGKRFIDVGIAEMTMIGAAAGLALRGRRPIVHALATFLTLRAFEFIRTDLGIGKLPSVLVGGVAGFLSEANGPTHQAIEDVSLLRGIPNMQVYCPADEAELAQALPALLDSGFPTYVRHNAMKPPVSHLTGSPVEHRPFEFGKAEIVEDGDDVAILTYGFLLREALGAAKLLRDKGHSVRVVNMRTLAPIDTAVVLESLKKSRVTLTVEDHFQTGGLYSIVAELCLAHRIAPKVVPMALNAKWFKPTLLAEVLRVEGFTAGAIAERASLELGRDERPEARPHEARA